MIYGSTYGGGSYAGTENQPEPTVFTGTGEFHIPLPILLGYGNTLPATVIRKAVVMNLSNHAVTEYKNYDFNSLAVFNGIFMGSNEHGVYVLEGNNDLGSSIEAHIRTGVNDLGPGAYTSIPKEAWLAYRSDGDILVEIEADEEDSYAYTFSEVTQKISEMGITLGKGFTERFYTIDIKNVDGSTFDIESLKITGNPVVGRRR